MEIRHKELEIDGTNPFLTCKLNRRKYGEVLTTIVSTFKDGFVLAINNKWGTGKTTFVRMWQQHLENHDFKTVYFNAWENDFDGNPLVAIMAELGGLLGKSNKTAFKSALKQGAVITKSVGPDLVKALIKPYFDADAVVEAVGNISKATADLLQTQIDEYAKRKDSIKVFRKRLEEFVARTDADKPIIFIIDELDRCRPDYAVEVLEQIKHFFSVKGIVFVISMDKEHLAASVRGFYGSEQINTDEYLRRFVDLEYSIPRPSANDFCKYLYEYFGFDDFFKSPDRLKFDSFRNDGTYFLKIAGLISDTSGATLRQMEKIFGQTRLILNSFKKNQYTFSHVLFILVYLAVTNGDEYSKLTRLKMSLQDVSNTFGNLFTSVDAQENRFLIMIEARLLSLYANALGNHEASLVTKGANEIYTTSIKSRFDDSDGSRFLADAIKYTGQEWDASHAKLDFLTNKIELTEDLIF